MLLNANTLILEMNVTKTQRELFVVIDEMKNILEHFGKKLEQQKEESSNRISQLEACLRTTLAKFEQYIHQAIPAYTEKEEGMLKNEIDMLKEEINKVKHNMSDKIILRKGLTEKIKKTLWQINVANRNQTNTKISISTKCTIRNGKQISSYSKHSQ